MNKTNAAIDGFLRNLKNWRDEATKLRAIVLASDLTEELKWRQPCYSFEGSNVAIIGVFKEYCSLGFFKGALLKDPKKILTAPGENSQSMRLVRFTSVEEIDKLKTVLKSYIKEAIDIEKAGLKVKKKTIAEQTVPEEFAAALGKNKALKKAFEALTPGRRRAYLLHFAGAKQSATRLSRIEKCVPQILAGLGLDD